MPNKEWEHSQPPDTTELPRLEPQRMAMRLRMMRLYSLARFLILAAAALFLAFVLVDALHERRDPNPLAMLALLVALALLIRRGLRWRHHFIAWQRFRRLQSGRCAFCASSLNGASSCPHCGACAWICRNSRIEIARSPERRQPLIRRPRLRRPVPGWLR